MADKQPLPGPGRFQWNCGGWFGSQFGGTAWLLPGGVTAFYQAPWVGIIWVAIFAAVNAFGFWLWNRRDRMEPFRAILLLLLACGIGGLLAVVSLDIIRSEIFQASVFRSDGRFLLQDYRHESLREAYLFFLIGIPALMGWFALMERGARKARAGQGSLAGTTQTSASAPGRS